MNNERLFLVDPYDENHIKLIEDFEKENKILTTTSEYIRKVSQVPRAIYEQNTKLSNETRASLFLESSSKITDICYIEGEKDRKTCSISFAPIKTKTKNRDLISYATDYSINTLGMKEVFIRVPLENKNMAQNLELKGYENLGIENNEILFLREKTEELSNQRNLA